MDHPTAPLSHLHALAISLDTADDAVAETLAALAGALGRTIASYEGLQLTITQHGYPVILTAFTTDYSASRPQTSAEADGPTDPTQANPTRADSGDLDDDQSVGRVVTSLRLPLELIDSGFEIGSRIVFYASAAGALVDLAADLAYALTPGGTGSTTGSYQPAMGSVPNGDGRGPLMGSDGQPLGIRLDADLPPGSHTFGLSGLIELSTINRAVGIMIDRGHHPDEVHATLRRLAAASGLAPHAFALRLLED